jgi:predicted transposase YdaD
MPSDDRFETKTRASTPHDRLFHHVFGNPLHAAGELRTILPSEVVERIDWSTLEPLPARFVDLALREVRSDVLFRVRLDGREVLLYLLLEHQSSPDPKMPLRLLEYVVRIWTQYWREHPGAHSLPAVIPMVLHHSARGWTAPTSLRELIDLDDPTFGLLARHIPVFELLLDDISFQEDRALRARAMSDFGRLTLLCLKQLPRSADAVADLSRWFDLCAAVLGAIDGGSAFLAIARYTLATTETKPSDLRAFARQLGPKAEEILMTGEQMLREEGHVEGRAEGRLEGRADVLLEILSKRFGELTPAVVTRVRGASAAELDGWIKRSLDAASLEGVLGST